MRIYIYIDFGNIEWISRYNDTMQGNLISDAKQDQDDADSSML